MNKRFVKIAAAVAVPVMALSLASCSEGGGGEDGGIDVSRVRVVLGSSSTTADTYQASHAFTTNVEKVLDADMKADAVGRTQAFQALENARDDGSTIMSFHDTAYLGIIYGAVPEKYGLDSWTVGPVYASNSTAAFLAAYDAPYDDLVEAAEWLVDNESETLTVAIEPGGTSELSFDAWYLWVADEYGQDVADQIKVFVTGSDEEKNQALWAGNADIIYGTITGNEQYTGDDVEEQVREKFLNLTGAEAPEGYDIPTFSEQGIGYDGEPYIFDKEYFILMPKDVDEAFAQALDEATAEAVETEAFIDEVTNVNLAPNYIGLDEAEQYLKDKRDRLAAIVEAAPDIADLTN